MLDRGEQIAFFQRDPVGEPMLVDVALCDFERAGREVDRVHPRAWKHPRGEDGERAAAGAQIEDGGNSLRLAGQRIILCERGHEEFADQAARHDDALVDIERHALDIGAVQEISGRLADRRPRFDQIAEPRPFVAQEPGVEKRVERVDWQREALQDEKGGFVEGGKSRPPARKRDPPRGGPRSAASRVA